MKILNIILLLLLTGNVIGQTKLDLLKRACESRIQTELSQKYHDLDLKDNSSGIYRSVHKVDDIKVEIIQIEDSVDFYNVQGKYSYTLKRYDEGVLNYNRFGVTYAFDAILKEILNDFVVNSIKIENIKNE